MNFSINTSAIFLLSLCLSACGTLDYREGLQTLRAGQSAQGLALLKKVSDEYPDSVAYRKSYIEERDKLATVLLADANAAVKRDELDTAEKGLAQIVEIWPDNSQLSNLRTTIFQARLRVARREAINNILKQGDKEQAYDLVQSSLNEFPTDEKLLDIKRQLTNDRKTRDSTVPRLDLLGMKPVSLEFRDANLKMVLDALSRTSGLNFILDSDVRSDTLTTISVQQMSLPEAISMMLLTSHLRQKVLNRNTLLIYPDRPEKIIQYQDLVIKSFYISNIEAKKIGTMLSNILKTKSVFVDDKLNIITIRDTPEVISLAQKLIASQDLSEPEVMLDLEVLEVGHTRAIDLGVSTPNTLTLTPLPSNGTTLLLSDLKHLSSSTVGIGGASTSLHLQDQTADVNILAHPKIRARNHEKASILIGNKIPIISTSITSTGVTSENIQYQDVGLKLEAEPSVYLENQVGVKLSLEVSSLGSQTTTNNGTVAYQISTRNASTMLRLNDGETQILAGLLENEERNSGNHIPGLGDIPIIGHLFSENIGNHQKTEIMLAITPHIVRNLAVPSETESTQWSGTESNVQVRLPAPTHGQSENSAIEPSSVQQLKLNLKVNKPISQIGDTTIVEVQADSSVALRGLPFEIKFDPKSVSVENVTEGQFLHKNNVPTVFNYTVDKEGGTIYVSTASSDAGGITGKGIVATFTLKAISTGKSSLSLQNPRPIIAGNGTPSILVDPPIGLGAP